MDDLIIKRRRWYQKNLVRIETIESIGEAVLFTCPCCGYPTLSSRGVFEICPLCGWEDDGQDDPYADEIWGGPNGDYSLSEARDNFNIYLTMYRQIDKVIFKQQAWKLPIKRALISIYNRMLETQDSQEIEDLKIQAEELEQQL